MSIHLRTLLPRLITGLLYISIILFGILTDSVTMMAAIFAILSAFATYEYQSITGINLYFPILKTIHAVMAGVLFYIIFTVISMGDTYEKFLIATLPYVAYYLFYIITELFRRRPHPIGEIAHAFFAHLYTTIPLGALMLLCHMAPEDTGQYLLRFDHTFWLLPIFVFIWLNDSGAYVVGSLIGKHQMAPHISPRKTIEGLIGGIVFTMAGAVAFCYFFPAVTSFFHWLMLAAIVGFFATFGDLFESLLKRSYDVKDSGNILPGHGGILDRIDSTILAAPPAFIYIILFIYL